jgi:hypothetical protein
MPGTLRRLAQSHDRHEKYFRRQFPGAWYSASQLLALAIARGVKNFSPFWQRLPGRSLSLLSKGSFLLVSSARNSALERIPTKGLKP